MSEERDPIQAGAQARPRILVPVDFEGASTRALDQARWLAGALHADVVLLHVHARLEFDHPEIPAETVTRIQELSETSVRQALADLAARVGAVETVLRHGDTAEQILEAARELHPVMVVMGTHGRRGLGRLFLGSVAAEVVRSCPVPVVTVRAQAGDVA
jgi:nucleotide-binding universal stress UspA family protein